MLKQLFILYMVAINLVTFFVFGGDKYRAKVQGWRISEQTLLYLTALGGWIGAMIGQSFFFVIRRRSDHLYGNFGLGLWYGWLYYHIYSWGKNGLF